MSDTKARARGADGWDDDNEDAAHFRPMTRQEAQAFRQQHPQVSVWSVVGAQAVVGAVVAVAAWLLSGDPVVAASALYGGAVVLLPAVLLALGVSRRNVKSSPLVGAVSFMSWAVVKIGFSVLMLLLAPKILQPLSWPALLVALVLCMQTYLLALLWRKR
jgi:ATP synthase protein I